MALKEAVQRLIKELKEDEQYRYSWQANIAMAFKDQAYYDKRTWDKDELHDTANSAAIHFLELLCK